MVSKKEIVEDFLIWLYMDTEVTFVGVADDALLDTDDLMRMYEEYLENRLNKYLEAK